MPHLHLLAASGTAQRRLIETTLQALAAAGYEDVRRQEGGDWHALLSENRGGLFGEKTAVVVEEAEKLGTLPEQLAPLLEPPGAGAVILLACKSEASAPVPKSLLSRCSLSKAAEPTPWSKDRDETIRLAAQKSGVSVRRDAVSLLKELFEDSGELGGETEKLVLFCLLERKAEIDATDVERFCLSDGSRSMLKFLDGLCNGRQRDTLEHLGILGRNAELLPILSALHNRVRLALYLCAFPQEKALVGKALGARDYATRQAEAAARRYGHAKLLQFVTGILRINANEKSGMGASWRDLEFLVIDLLSA